MQNRLFKTKQWMSELSWRKYSTLNTITNMILIRHDPSGHNLPVCLCVRLSHSPRGRSAGLCWRKGCCSEGWRRWCKRPTRQRRGPGARADWPPWGGGTERLETSRETQRNQNDRERERERANVNAGRSNRQREKDSWEEGLQTAPNTSVMNICWVNAFTDFTAVCRRFSWWTETRAARLWQIIIVDYSFETVLAIINYKYHNLHWMMYWIALLFEATACHMFV